jgi:hypothetical protein
MSGYGRDDMHASSAPPHARQLCASHAQQLCAYVSLLHCLLLLVLLLFLVRRTPTNPFDMAESSRQVNPKAQVASGEFDRRRQAGVTQPGVENIGRQFGLKQGQLRNFRANYVSRKRRQ